MPGEGFTLEDCLPPSCRPSFGETADKQTQEEFSAIGSVIRSDLMKGGEGGAKSGERNLLKVVLNCDPSEGGGNIHMDRGLFVIGNTCSSIKTR